MANMKREQTIQINKAIEFLTDKNYEIAAQKNDALMYAVVTPTGDTAVFDENALCMFASLLKQIEISC